MHIFFIMVILLLGSSTMWLSLSDPDLWWHLVIGRWILNSGQIPSKDIWNQFSDDSTFRAYSWSFEAFIAGVESFSGFEGLLILKLALAILLTFSLALVFWRQSKEACISVALAVIVSAGLSQYYGLRPQTLSWFCFLAALYAAERISESDKNSFRELAILLLSVVVWANTNITVIIGIASVGAWILQRNSGELQIVKAIKIVLLCFIFSLLTPYLGGEWQTLLNKSNHPFAHSYIREFQPATLYNISAAIATLLGVFLFLLLHYQSSAISLLKILLLACFFVAGFTIQKFLPFALISSGFLIAVVWGRFLENETAFSKLGEGIHLFSSLLSTSPKWLMSIGSIVGLVFVVAYLQQAVKEPLDTNLVPISAVDFLIENDLPTPLLHGFDEGGYLMYRFSNLEGLPSRKVILDGRTNVNDPKVVKDFLQALKASSLWGDIFERIQPKTVLWQNRYPLSTILQESGDWCRVFPSRNGSRWSIYLSKQEWLRMKHTFISPVCENT